MGFVEVKVARFRHGKDRSESMNRLDNATGDRGQSPLPCRLPSPQDSVSILFMNRPRAFVTVASFLLSCIAGAQTSPTPEPVAKPSPSAPPPDYDFRWGVKIPMRDRVE